MSKTSELKGYDGFLAERLRIIMENKKISQAELARYVGISKQTISLYYLGDSLPTLDKLRRICKYLEVPADFLLGLTPSHEKDLKAQQIEEMTGLSSEAIENLKLLHSGEFNRFGDSRSYVIDFMLSDYDFMDCFPDRVDDYLDVRSAVDISGSSRYLDGKYVDELDYLRYSVVRQIERLIDNYYNSFMESPNYKKRRKRKEEVTNGNDTKQNEERG